MTTPRCRCRSVYCPHCRPGRRASGGGDYGIIGPLLLFGGIFAVIGFWPAMVWHGYGGPTGTAWRWDIHSTIGCLVYWGVLIFIFTLVAIGNRPAKAARPPRPERVRSWPPPERVPPSGPDPALTMRLLAGLDAIDARMTEAEKARTGEELDYLNAYGRLPGRERRTR